VTRLRTGWSGNRVQAGGGNYCRIWKLPDPTWSSPSLFIGFQYPWWQSGRDLKLTARLHLLSRLKMFGTIHLFAKYVHVAHR